MPRSKDARSYSREYGEVLKTAYLKGEHTVLCPSWKIAKKTQSEFYSFMTAIKKAPEAHPDILEAAHQVSMSVKGTVDTVGPVAVHFYNKENAPIATLLRDSLGMQKASEEAKDSEMEMLRRLDLLPKVEPAAPVGNPDVPFTYDAPMSTAESTMDPQLQEKAKSVATGYLGRAPRT